MQDVLLDTREHYHCPHCGEDLSLHALEAFQQIECSSCGRISRIPGYFGDYELTEKLSESITSSLFRGYDPRLGRKVSLKILHYVLSRNSELVEAFKREALAAAALNSPNVLKVYEFGIHNHQPFMVLENIEGRFLHDVIQEGSLTGEQTLDIVDGIVQGLEDTHDQGIVHGDVMPRNILIHTDGTARISDFGLARFSGEETELLESWSSPYYMPPERIRGDKEDHRADFYSLGTTLYYMLCGRLPYFDLDDEVVLRKKLEGPPPDPRVFRETLQPELAELAMLLLERNPEERPGSFDDMRRVLTAVHDAMPAKRPDVPELDAPPEPLYKTPNPVKEEPLLVIILFCLVGILGALLIGHFSRQWHAKEPNPVQTPTPEPTPAVTPTAVPILPTATPVPEPTPTPLVPPTPTPLPDLSFQRTLHLTLDDVRLDESGSVTAWSRQEPKQGFVPGSGLPAPVIEKNADGVPSLRFEQNVMLTGRMPHRSKQYTVILWVRPHSLKQVSHDQVLLGVDARAPGERRFLIYMDETLPGSYSFETEKGSTRIILPVAARDQPVPLALVHGPKGDQAFADALTSPLSGAPRPREETDFKVLPAIQMGGLMDQEMFFNGHIYRVSFYDRALEEPEIRRIFGNAPGTGSGDPAP